MISLLNFHGYKAFLLIGNDCSTHDAYTTTCEKITDMGVNAEPPIARHCYGNAQVRNITAGFAGPVQR